ncbi:hypothetical protein N9O57_01100 [bacterium]|nr:hypothetical protein [bacterium]
MSFTQIRSILVLFALLICTKVFSASSLDKIFKVKKPIMAALFLELPTKLDNKVEIQKTIDWGISQIKILERQKVDSILWEFSFGGIMSPSVTPKALDVMVHIINSISKYETDIILGVEILWHFPYATIELAKRTSAKYIRLDFFSDPMTAGGTIVPMEAEKIIAFKNTIGASDLIIFTDVQVKYAKMIDSSTSMTESTLLALSKGSNGLIVSGRKSGHPPELKKVEETKIAAKSYDVILGSGTNSVNIIPFLQFADGAIVGSSISEQTGGPLIESKVKEYMKSVFQVRQAYNNTMPEALR